MALVGNGWLKEWPVNIESGATSAIISGSTKQIRSNWEHLEAVLSGHHTSISVGGSAQHKAGKTAALSLATCATICAYTSAGPGAMAWTTDTGEFLTWRDNTMPLSGSAPTTGEWQSVTLPTSAWSRVRAVFIKQQTIASGTMTVLSAWSDSTSNQWDDLGEFNKDTGIFTAAAAGYYLIMAMVRYTADELDGGQNTLHAACISATGGYYYSYNGCWGMGEACLDLHDIIYLSAGQKLCVCAYHTDSGYSQGLTIVGGSIAIHRIL